MLRRYAIALRPYGHRNAGRDKAGDHPFYPVLIGYDMMSSAVVTILEVLTYAKSEVSSIEKPPEPKVDVQESISNVKAYCKQDPEGVATIV